MLDIVLRTCDRVYSIHKEILGTDHRVTGPDITKLEITMRCLNSLIRSMNRVDYGLRLIVIDDHSVGLEKIKKLLEQCKHPTEFISLENTGNGASMYACFKWAKDNGRERLFFVEDDYLHDVNCISEMIYEHDFFRMKLNNEVALFPSDNIEIYTHPQKNSIQCNIGIGRNRHWRSTIFSSYTFLCSKEILERYWYLFAMNEGYGKDLSINEGTTINAIWEAPYKNAGGAYLLSPIPSLSLHLHFKDHISPFINWKSWWDKNEYEINN